MDRRTFIKTSALAGAALTCPELVQNANASLPNTAYFDLTQSSTEFFRNVPLHSTSGAMQSAAFNAHDYLYILSTKNGANGDMWLTRRYPDHSDDGYMVLSGAGHGVAMGIDNWNDPIYIWTESESTSAGRSDGEGRGRKLQRFNFHNGTTITHSDAEVFDPTIHLEGTTQYQLSCSIDPTYKRIAIRYSKSNTSGTYYFMVYNLADFNNHNYIPLLAAPVKMPAKPSGAGTPQGWCLYGSWIYASWGDKRDRVTYPSSCPGTVASAQAGGSMLGRLNLNNPTQWYGYDSQVGYTLCDREPEGLSVRVYSGKPQLMVQVSGENSSQAHNSHYASFYYKDKMIAP